MSAREEHGGGTAPDAVRRPFGVVVASAVDGLRTLARNHVELARLEVTEAASVRVQGLGMIVAAAVVAMYAVGFVAAAGAAGLAVVLPTWAAILIVAALLVGGADPGNLEGGRSMGEATDRKVTEIDETRRRLEVDLRELESRIPPPFRW